MCKVNDKRITISLGAEEYATLQQISSLLDVDQGKVIRWGIKTMQEMTRSACQSCRDGLSPQGKYLFDNLSSITKK